MGFSLPGGPPSTCSLISGNGRSSKYSANFLRSKSGRAAGVSIPTRSVCPRNGLIGHTLPSGTSHSSYPIPTDASAAFGGARK
eukprot:4517610-Alexandrium_andersonii.AAC.1